MVVEFLDYPLPEAAREDVLAAAVLSPGSKRATGALYERRLLAAAQAADLLRAQSTYPWLARAIRAARQSLRWRIAPAIGQNEQGIEDVETPIPASGAQITPTGNRPVPQDGESRTDQTKG